MNLIFIIFGLTFILFLLLAVDGEISLSRRNKQMNKWVNKL